MNLDVVETTKNEECQTEQREEMGEWRRAPLVVSFKYYRTKCSTLKMSQLLNTNDRKLLIEVAKFVYFGMKEYTSLPDDVSEEIDNVDLNCLYD